MSSSSPSAKARKARNLEVAREEMIEHLAAMQTVMIRRLGHTEEVGLAKLKPTWPWTGKCLLGLARHLLRHLQHHVAELNYS